MTNTEMILTVKTLVGNDAEATDDVVSLYLSVALNKMVARLYPFDDAATTIPDKYQMTQCELAARLFLRRGGEGEKSHNENGINRTYGSVDDEDILARLTPYAKIV